MENNIEQELIKAANEGVRNALTKSQSQADYRCGAAVLTSSKNIYSSGSFFSDTYSLLLHAEQAALAHAAAHGEYEIQAIAVASNRSESGRVYPCHMCKQLLWESHLRSQAEIEILIVENDRIVERLKVSEIINYPWPPKK